MKTIYTKFIRKISFSELSLFYSVKKNFLELGTYLDLFSCSWSFFVKIVPDVFEIIRNQENWHFNNMFNYVPNLRGHMNWTRGGGCGSELRHMVPVLRATVFKVIASFLYIVTKRNHNNHLFINTIQHSLTVFMSRSVSLPCVRTLISENKLALLHDLYKLLKITIGCSQFIVECDAFVALLQTRAKIF